MKRLLVLALLAGCPAGGTSAPGARAEVTAASDDTGPPLRSVTSSIASADKPAPVTVESCGAEMFTDHAPGAHGLHVYEDPGGAHGFRDAADKVVIAPRFRFAYEFGPGGIAAVVDGQGPAFIATDGRVLARAYLFDNGPDYFVAGRARIVDKGKLGFIDDTGRIVIAPQFDFATGFCRNRAAVCHGCKEVARGEYSEFVGGRWGYIDREGAIVIPITLDAAEPFAADGTAEVTDKGQRLRIDLAGHPLP